MFYFRPFTPERLYLLAGGVAALGVAAYIYKYSIYVEITYKEFINDYLRAGKVRL